MHRGDAFVTKANDKITTVLGSCVAVVLWDSVNKIGGMNHYLHARGKQFNMSPLFYGETSIMMLIKRMQYLGAENKNMQAKIFGGASKMDAFTVWSENIKIAEEILKSQKIEITKKNTGGSVGRNILFFTDTGIVKHRFMHEI